MALDSTTTRIVEEVDSSLVDDDGMITVEVIDYGSDEASEYEIPTKIDNTFGLDLTRFLPNDEIMDLEKFIEVTSDLIAWAQDKEGVPSSRQVSLTAEYPAERMDRFGQEVITWKLIRRSPALTSPDGKSVPQHGFRYSYKVRLPKYPNRWIEVERRPLDHIVEFQCWAKTAREANARALWLERLLVNHTWAYVVQGAELFRFEERLTDWYTSPSGQNLYVRPLRFFFRASEFKAKAHSIIRNVTMEIGNLSPEEITAFHKL